MRAIMETSKQSLGKRIKELRLKSKLTQAQLAENVGIDSKHLSRIEGGKNYPSLETLEGLAKNLNVEIGDLFELSHLMDKQALISQITELLQSSDTENVKTIYRLVKDVLK